MDAKVTLSFNKKVIENAKKFAADHNMSLSRLTEFLYHQITTGQYHDLEDLPISSWVQEVAEGGVEYKKTPSRRKDLKDEFFQSRK